MTAVIDRLAKAVSGVHFGAWIGSGDFGAICSPVASALMWIWTLMLRGIGPERAGWGRSSLPLDDDRAAI
jgi:hypothetical protein